MKFTIKHPEIKGKITANLTSKGETIYFKDNITEDVEIELDENENKFLRLEMTYLAPQVSTKNNRIKYFFDLLKYHILPIKTDSDMYSYSSHPGVKKVFELDRFESDTIFNYAPYLESTLELEDDEDDRPYVKFSEDDTYPYHWINRFACVTGFILLVLTVCLIGLLNWLWIKEQ